MVHVEIQKYQKPKKYELLSCDITSPSGLKRM